jgi:hypothetical protein
MLRLWFLSDCPAESGLQVGLIERHSMADEAIGEQTGPRVGTSVRDNFYSPSRPSRCAGYTLCFFPPRLDETTKRKFL